MLVARPWARGHEPLPGRAFVHQNFLNDQSIHVHAGVVFRVGESRTDHTENDAGGLIRREAQQVHGSLNRHTLHVAGDQPGLARRNAHEFGSSFRFHDWHPLFLGLGLLVGGMAVEGARRREFPKLVSHHVFGDENGRNFLPLCTAKVIPTISGRTVDRRDQVFTTRRSLVSTAVSTFFIRWSSTKGPFSVIWA